MKKTLIKENGKRVVNKRYWNSEIKALKKIESEQNDGLAFCYLTNLVIPEYLKELGFLYDSETKEYSLKEIKAKIGDVGIYAYLKFYTENVSKKINIKDTLTTPSTINTEICFKELIKENKILGDLSTLASEILISIRDVWNLSNQNLCFFTLERKHYVNKNRKWEESSH